MGTVAPAVSVIILTRNRKDDVLEMLRSLQVQRFRNFEVVVVDQASLDCTSEGIAQEFPEVRIVRLEQNLGVPGGRNVGIRNARGEILFFLDDDATLEADGLAVAWDEFRRHADVGVVTGQVIDYETGALQQAYWVYPQKMLSQSEVRFDTYTFSGGVHAIRRTMLERTGLYDELLFFSQEEYGLSLRCFAEGFRIVYNPRIVLRHKGRHRAGWDAERWQLFVRGRLYVVLFYCPTVLLAPLLLEYIVGHFVQAIRNGFVRAYWGALVSLFRNRVAVIQHRNPLRRASFRSFRRLERSQRGSILYRISHELFRTRRVAQP